MKISPFILRKSKNALFLILLFFSSILLKAESRKDTLVIKAWLDTVRLQKAQIVDLDENTKALYFRPKPFEFAKNVPLDLYELGKTTFSKSNLPKLGAILAGTAILVVFDQKITDAAQQFGRYINLSSNHNFTPFKINIGGSKITVLDVPQNLNMVFYFLGEGWPSIMIAGGFYSYGLATNDYRALQTTSQLTEMFFTLAITTQFLKRISGRESPFIAMTTGSGIPGGDWRPFTNPKTYQSNVSGYDAFPSGHLATAMATITILAGNYPDNKYIKPVGYSLMGLLGYAMLNNGVHWISDYPLAIAIGYTCGKIALSRGRQIIPKLSTDHGSSSTLMPAFIGTGGIGLRYQATF